MQSILKTHLTIILIQHCRRLITNGTLEQVYVCECERERDLGFADRETEARIEHLSRDWERLSISNQQNKIIWTTNIVTDIQL